MNDATVEIIIVTAKRKALLERCLQTALRCEDARIAVVVNGRDELTLDLLQTITQRDDRVRYVVLERRSAKSKARNAGIMNATSEIVYFLDDDVCPAPGNLRQIKSKFKAHPEVDIVGGPNLNPEGSSFFQRISGHALASPFVSWRMQKRYSRGITDESCTDQSLILCNLAMRRRIFEQENIYFDERLEYNEENLLLHRFRERGRLMLYCPEIVVYHERRDTLEAFARQVFKSGEGRALMTVFAPRSFSPVYALPAVFVLYLLSLPLLWKIVSFYPLLVYLVLDVLNAGVIMAMNKEPRTSAKLLLILPFVAHLSYGAGFIRGIKRGISWKN